MNTLQALRIYGPLNIHSIAVLRDETWAMVYHDCLVLEDQGLARQGDDDRWDVTKDGRDLFKAECANRRRDAACEGVRP